tara:strand:+ start:428 stop:772 length:345 start_codon:yes stop_codon:yes gene_type:complete
VLQRHFQAIAFPHIPTAYDLLAHHKSGEFLKCQVKTAAKIKEINGSKYWAFKTKKESGAYGSSEVDFFALVVLPKRAVFFLSNEDATGTCYIKESDATPERELETLHDVLGEYL